MISVISWQVHREWLLFNDTGASFQLYHDRYIENGCCLTTWEHNFSYMYIMTGTCYVLMMFGEMIILSFVYYINMEDCQYVIRKTWPWPMVSKVFGECHALSFVDFGKEWVHCSRYNRQMFVSIQSSLLSSGIQKPNWPIIPSFLCCINIS